MPIITKRIYVITLERRLTLLIEDQSKQGNNLRNWIKEKFTMIKNEEIIKEKKL